MKRINEVEESRSQQHAITQISGEMLAGQPASKCRSFSSLNRPTLLAHSELLRSLISFSGGNKGIRPIFFFVKKKKPTKSFGLWASQAAGMHRHSRPPATYIQFDSHAHFGRQRTERGAEKNQSFIPPNRPLCAVGDDVKVKEKRPNWLRFPKCVHREQPEEASLMRNSTL